MVIHILSPTRLFFLALSLFFATIHAEDNYESIVLVTTSSNATYDNRPLSHLNGNLQVIFMNGFGPQGGQTFGWSSSKSELADHTRTYNYDTGEPIYVWVPLILATEWQGYDGVPGKVTKGLGAPFFPYPGHSYDGDYNQRMQNDFLIANSEPEWRFKANLTVHEDGRIGMKNDEGVWESKWWACDGLSFGSGVHWSFEEGKPNKFYADRCVSLEIWKTTKPVPTPTPSAVISSWPGIVSTTVSHRFYPPTQAPARPVEAAKQTTNSARQADAGVLFSLLAACATAALAL